MTTLEVVEAVQRSLENEGLLQSIRAQLRSNVLRIISSGPDYPSKAGKSIVLAQSKHGSIVVQLVKDFMEEYGLKESLAVFEAEVGFDKQSTVNRARLLKELNVEHQINDSVLENLVSDVLSRELRVDPSRTSPAEVDQHEVGAEYAESVREDDQEEDDNGNYSQIEDAYPSNHSHHITSSASSGLAESTRGSSDSHASPKLHSSFHQQLERKLDESSSFEADSPIRGPPSGATQLKFVPSALDDSFVEEPEEDFSIEEEIEEENIEKHDVRVSREDEQKSKREMIDAGNDDKSVEYGADGPEYESDGDVDAKDNSREAHFYSSKEDSERIDANTSGKHERDAKQSSPPTLHSASSLRPAVAGDFDPMDRNAIENSFSGSNNSVHRISVRHAGGDEAESKNPVDAVPGTKASVLRLGQSSISRSHLGWGSEGSTGVVEDHSDNEEILRSSPANNSRTSRGIARYSTNGQMEAVSFDSEEDEHQASPVRGEQRRSTNQESESEDDAAVHNRNVPPGSSRDFDVENSDDDVDEVSFGDDVGELPSASSGTSARPAFLSAPKQTEQQNRSNDLGEHSEEEEYEDDDFVDEEEEGEDDEDKGKSPAELPKPVSSLFQARPTNTLNRVDKNQEEEEEEIEEEEFEDMSVGSAYSDEGEDGFGSPVVAKQQQKTTESTSASGSMFRAGRSGALPGVKSATNFDAVLNSFEADSDEDDDGGGSSYLPSSKAVTKLSAPSASSISSRMLAIDSQLEELEHSDPRLAKLRDQVEDENSVASEDIDAMEFSTGGGHDNDSESSGEGSFSFLDSSSKK